MKIDDKILMKIIPFIISIFQKEATDVNTMYYSIKCSLGYSENNDLGGLQLLS